MALTCSPTSLAFTAAGGTYERVIFSNSNDEDNGFAVVASSVPSWLSFSPEYGSAPSEHTAVTCAANPDRSSRKATVRFRSYADGSACALTVTQEGYDSFLLQYYGEFVDIKVNTWRVEVRRKSNEGILATEITFPADSPLVIEWPSQGFEDALWGSSATLRVISDSDRRFIDLYTVEVGIIRLDVYKNGSLYWSGMLDPEFYEEPYEKLSGYEVELTFTDFGILDRLKYDLEGMRPAGYIIAHALELAGFEISSNDGRFPDIINQFWNISFAGDSDPRNLLMLSEGLSVNSENFSDEEGEVSSMRDAVEGILQPLGLKLVQRAGMIYLFDIAGLRQSNDSEQVVWNGDSQTLGVDKVYNGVVVTFSPYVKRDLWSDGVTFDAPYDINDINTSATSSTDPRYYTYIEGDESNNYSFTLFISTEGSGISFTGYSLGEYAHILPIYGSATECDCIPALYTTADVYGYNSQTHGSVPGYYGNTSSVLFYLPYIYIPPVPDEGERKKWYIRVKTDLLVDCRYNPFDEDDDHYTSEQNRLKNNSAMVGNPFYVTVFEKLDGGDYSPLCHYKNTDNYNGNGGSWADGEASYGDAWMTWYNAEDLTDNAGAAGIGWKGNRQRIAFAYRTAAPARWRHCDDGEYLPYPPQGGWLRVGIGNYLRGFQYAANTDFIAQGVDDWTKSELRWVLFGNFAVDLVFNDLSLEASSLDDVEYRGTLNEAAQDDLQMDTICGTAAGAPPTARGVFLDSDGAQVSELTRDGVTDRPEKLLIGQLYGQYAGRNTVLTGEAEIPDTLLLTEQNQSGKTFILMGDTQDIRMATSEIEIRELGEDRYTSE